MKYIVIIGDGCADIPIPSLGGKTPLEAAHTPNMDRLASNGRVGLAKTVPDGVPPGSDTAILSIFGYDPRKYYTGRSPLEAAGSGVKLSDGEISMRTNVVSLGDEADFFDKTIYSHNGGNVEGEQSIALMEELLSDGEFAALAKKLDMRFKLNPSFRHIAVVRGVERIPPQPLPHDILGQRIGGHLPRDPVSEMLTDLMRRAYAVMDKSAVNAARRAKGQLPANCIWFWGEGRAVALPSFADKYRKSARVITAVPLVSGIGALAGLPSIDVPGATGDIDTNYSGKAQAAIQALRDGSDIIFVHVEAPDECSHAGDLDGKIKSIENIDTMIVGPMAEALRGVYDYRMLYLSDHPTLLSTRTHDGAPVPYFIYDSRCAGGAGAACFGESMAASGQYIPEGTSLMENLLQS